MTEQQHTNSISKVSKDYRVLGTWCNLTLFGVYDTSLLDAAYRLIQYYEDLFTVNHAGSQVMKINRAAGDRTVEVTNATYSLVRRAVRESRKRYGFNAAIGPLVKLWHIGFEDARVPTDEEIAERRKLINPDDIELNDYNLSVYLPQAGMELDLGGIAKGYIADRIQDFWRAYGLTAGIINLGGNLLMMGDAPHNADGKWCVGIRNPLEQNDETILTITTGASSVVTSGVAERYFEAAGKSYHHIIDPETGYPHDNNIASVTVLSRESIDGEIETTRLFFADGPLPGYDYGALFIYRDRSIELVNLPKEAVHIFNPEFYFKETKMSDDNLIKVDLCCGINKPEGFIGVDCIPGDKVDIVADLNGRFPFEDNSVDVVRAHSTIEHLPDKIHTMNEIWRICKPNGIVDISVPSTDGRGAFQDPTHVSFWNINSFLYYSVNHPPEYELCKRHGFLGGFKIEDIYNVSGFDSAVYVHVVLRTLK